LRSASLDPEQWYALPRSRSDEGDRRQLFQMSDGRSRPTERQNAVAAQEKRVSRPKLGRRGRREIGRALEAMYEDVIKQGVPPGILKLLESLDARAGDAAD
jgi:hypothetical protein